MTLDDLKKAVDEMTSYDDLDDLSNYIEGRIEELESEQDAYDNAPDDDDYDEDDWDGDWEEEE